MRLDGYIRVSRVGGREGEGYISPEVQRSAIIGYANELGGEVVAWHSDEDYSGGNTERPGFQAVLERLRAGETDGVVVMRVDRFARSVVDGATVVREIIERGQVFASCHERIDPRTPEGKFMLTSFLANSELFLDQARAAWWTAKGLAIARGAHIGPTPVGYLRIRAIPTKPSHISPLDSAAIGGPTAPGVLVPSPTHGPAIKELFARCATGRYGDSVLAQWMTARAPRTRGVSSWQPSEVRRWLSSRVYLGEVHYGDLVNRDAHEPLTDPEVWERCQRAPGVQHRPHRRFLLSGLVRCAHCRYAMGGQTYGGARHSTPVYRCTGRGRCDQRAVIVAERLEAFVIDSLKMHLSGLATEEVGGQELAHADRQARDAIRELEAFTADLEARSLLGEDGWREGLRIRVANRDTKVATRDELAAQQRHAMLALRLTEMGEHELRDLLAAVRYVFVRRQRGVPAGERALIVWADDPRGFDVPGPHRSGPFEPVRW